MKIFKQGRVFLGLLSIGLFLVGCGNNSSGTADTSGDTSEISVATVGGAINSTAGDSVSLIQMKNNFEFAQLLSPIPSAFASSIGRCPTSVHAFDGVCAVAGHAMTLTFPTDGCVYGVGVGPIWLGGTVLTTTGNAPACGTYPAIDGTTITAVNRTYLGNLLADPTSRTNKAGVRTVVLDTSTPSSTTFANAKSTSPTSGTGGYKYNISSGGGYTRTFVSATDHDLAIAIRTVAYKGSTPSGTVGFDHTVSTTDSAGTSTPLVVSISGTKHTVNGTLNLQHNLLKMTAASNFDAVKHDTSLHCCYPIAGTVTTTFTGGPNDGKHETMVFSDATCTLATLGQVDFTDINGTSSTKTLTHCF